jgi:oligoribonuclease NrnB/cAMP/cGMP phosphodiesterase (DHH superfamily)
MSKNIPVNPQRVLVAYHDNCIDGFTSYWVAQKALKQRGCIPYGYPMRYGQDEEVKLAETLKSEVYSHLYVLDFSLRPKVLEDLRSWHPLMAITVIDHHKTAFEMYDLDMNKPGGYRWDIIVSGSARVLLNNDRSGAGMTWHHFFPGQYSPYLISFVEDYDLWTFEYGNETKYINQTLNTIEKTIDNWDEMYEELATEDGRHLALKCGARLYSDHMQEVRVIASRGRDCRIGDTLGRCVMCPPEYINEVGAILSATHQTFGACFRRREDGSEVWSLRSVGDTYDVSTLAKKYGGGGHKNSAGFEVMVPQAVNSIEIFLTDDDARRWALEDLTRFRKDLG